MAANREKRHRQSSLMHRLSLPIYALIVTFIALFAVSASYILIRVQNDHTRQLAEQSTSFVRRNLEYQFDTMNNMAAFLLTNQSIENLLESDHPAPFEAVEDFFALQANLENLSLLSLLNDSGSGSVVQQSYAVSVALGPGSGLYALATDHYDPVTGIYKDDDLKDQPWYKALSGGERQNAWWGQKAGRASAAMIYSATRKTSIKDGRAIGTVIIGADTGSIRSAFDNAALKQGYHLLMDEAGRVIFSERYRFLEPVGELPYVRAAAGAGGSFVARIDGESHRVMQETMDNGWKLLTVVPESHFNRYTWAISAIGAVTAAAALLIAGYWLRRIVVRVTVPITRLVGAVQRPEVLAFEEPLPAPHSGIYEVDALNQKFASMLVTLHGLIEKSFAEEIERRQLQLELLNAQINPHFLYNTLDLINCRAILSGDEETGAIVRSLANVFRYGLNRGQTWISLAGEIKQVEAYLHIQRMMMEDLRVDIQVPEDLLAVQIPHFCLQPLAENAIVHGFAGRTDDCRIAISARVDGESLVLRVADNGRGCDAEAMNRALRHPPAGGPGASAGEPEPAGGAAEGGGSGYGTMNVHRRIQLHCGEAYGLRYVQTDAGACVEAVLPYQTNRSQREKGAEA
ncbi:cache domain-containing sensor histidine kinase [Cohnella nanjingensis]|uniref:Histidine kinase n=1 Tax=Cohnella nanjingensis TaxID=1387779 RepID=A0A7X0RNR9_9BACL|nr:sensor histidine kinase [Cohnella nanjingensis]MBB6670746.1 histidine kinase [Cohnella nanjingensis]